MIRGSRERDKRRLLTALRRLTALEKSAAVLPELGQRLAALERSVEAVSELARRMTASAKEVSAASARIEGLEHALDEQRRHLQVRTVMDWIAHATVRTAPLVSIVLPTRDRCAWLPRAIASVRAQTYPHWELLIVDDRSVDDTPALLAGISGGQLRTFRARGAGVCAARNVALAHARGEIIAYLDDDNVMHPGWLKSVVWGFEQRPEAETLYGAFVVDDTARVLQVDRGDLPRLCFYAYDHKAVAENNIADMGCIAHRAGLPEAHFDESLRELGDWDLFLRLTRDRPPLALPAIACFYTTDAPHRLSNGPTNRAERATVRAKNRRPDRDAINSRPTASVAPPAAREQFGHDPDAGSR